jgi:class 3 adenylate cyclase/tetratricopeptide (TPR) repeat protein
MRCPGCGEENPDRFRLCGYCGEPLVKAVPLATEVRKTVTVVFSDLQGSTSLGEKLDSESLREVLNLYFRAMQIALERHGGTVEKFIGDAVMAVFGLPRLHEDDALRAVRAAADMQFALAAVNDQLEAGYGVRLTNRTGVNTGEVVAGDVTAGQRLVTGDVVNTAARLEQNAPANEVLLGETTYRLVRDAVEVEPVTPLELKGKAERVAAYRLLAVRGGEAVTRHMERPLVGRQRELAVLDVALTAAIAESRPQLVTVLGSAGVGKSRLLDEYLRGSSDRAATVAGHCLNYGEGITFWPLAEIAKGAAGIVNDDDAAQAIAKLRAIAPGDDGGVVDRVAAAIGLSSTTFRVEELFWGATRFFETLAAERPLIVLVNDLHWAEKTFLDLLVNVLEAAQAPIVIVGSARHDLLEDHPEWEEARPRAQLLQLEPLTGDESAQVIGNLLGTSTFDPAIGQRIAESAQGNPLFVEQMLSMLMDDGVLAQNEGGEWTVTGNLAEVIVPPSISALLSARLDRLPGEERSVLERASIVGRVFWPVAVITLGEDPNASVDQPLDGLSQKQLIGATTSWFADDLAYQFLHILIRDETYSGILKRRRAELHERFADWMLMSAGIRLDELREIVGYHLEQAVAYRRELGPLDERGTTLASRASEQIGLAGRRAFNRGDMPAAGNLLRRAADILPRDDQRRGRLLLAAGEALSEAGDFGAAEVALTDCADDAVARGDRGLEATATVARLHLQYASEGGDAAAIRAQTEEAIGILDRLGDEGGLVRAWRLMALVGATIGKFADAESAATKMIEHAQRSGDEVMEKRFLGLIASSVPYGPKPVVDSIELSESLLARAGDDSKSQGLIMAELSRLHAMMGDFAGARDLYQRSRALLEEHGWRLYAATTSLDSGRVEMLAGDPEAAERELRHDFETLEAMGERNYIVTVAADLAEALLTQRRDEEARELTHYVEDNAAADDYAPQVIWRRVRGRILADRGDTAAGEKLIREGLAIVVETDDIDATAEVYQSLAEVLALAGRREESVALARQALGLYDQKGDVVRAERVKNWLMVRDGSLVQTS